MSSPRILPDARSVGRRRFHGVPAVRQRIQSGAMALSDAPVVGRVVGRYITPITYRGRKSGRTFTLPVGYRRAGNTVTIGVELAERKKWWRNFLGDGGPLTIRLDGVDRTGHAVARRTAAAAPKWSSSWTAPGEPTRR